MKKFYLAAALLMAAGSAHAGSGISFVVDGQKIRIDAPKNCTSLDCIKITGVNTSKFNFKGFGSKKDDDDDVAPAPAAPAPVVAAPAAPAPPPAPVASTAPVAPPVTTTVQPQQLAATVPAQLPPAAPAAVAAPPAPVTAAPVQAANTPLGVWATEEDKGDVRIEQCGADLCGYAVKSGERILINMKPEGSKWTGRIHDPDSGKDYDSTIALKGTNLLKVQGCAFGGMFCGGQTWKRIS